MGHRRQRSCFPTKRADFPRGVLPFVRHFGRMVRRFSTGGGDQWNRTSVTIGAAQSRNGWPPSARSANRRGHGTPSLPPTMRNARAPAPPSLKPPSPADLAPLRNSSDHALRGRLGTTLHRQEPPPLPSRAPRTPQPPDPGIDRGSLHRTADHCRRRRTGYARVMMRGGQ